MFRIIHSKLKVNRVSREALHWDMQAHYHKIVHYTIAYSAGIKSVLISCCVTGSAKFSKLKVRNEKHCRGPSQTSGGSRKTETDEGKVKESEWFF